MTIKPITPDEIVVKKREDIPDFVIDEWNKLIAEKWDGYVSQFRQDEIVGRIVEVMTGGIPNTSVPRGSERSVFSRLRQEVFEKNWLDVEGLYREAGWEVKYDRPGYNEAYPAMFEFRRAKEK